MPVVSGLPVTIELHPDWSASSGECGSCRYFKRRASSLDDSDTHGVCMFVLPKHIASKIDIPPSRGTDHVWEVDPRTVQDRDSCDLYKSTGRQYAQKRYWSAP